MSDSRSHGALRLSDVSSGYAMGEVLREVSLVVDVGEVVSVLGRNGAGKTTLTRAIMGTLPVSAGRILLDGEDVSSRTAIYRARAGLRWVPQDDSVFPGLTVGEHLRVSAQNQSINEAVLGLFPVLKDRRAQQATTLSGGERKMLGIAGALLGGPKVLVLDEPSEGVAPKIVEELAHVISEVASNGCAVLLMEQNLTLAVAVAQRAYVMERGQVADAISGGDLRSQTHLTERIGL